MLVSKTRARLCPLQALRVLRPPWQDLGPASAFLGVSRAGLGAPGLVISMGCLSWKLPMQGVDDNTRTNTRLVTGLQPRLPVRSPWPGADVALGEGDSGAEGPPSCHPSLLFQTQSEPRLGAGQLWRGARTHGTATGAVSVGATRRSHRNRPGGALGGDILWPCQQSEQLHIWLWWFRNCWGWPSPRDALHPPPDKRQQPRAGRAESSGAAAACLSPAPRLLPALLQEQKGTKPPRGPP